MIEQHIDPMLGQVAGAHHGDPTLYERDIKLLRDFNLWVKTVREWREKGNPGWLPTEPDVLKSRLFWRIRSGKAPLSHPPPTSFSCPWYELIEDCVPHNVGPTAAGWTHIYRAGEQFFGETLQKGIASINQDCYTIEEDRGDEFTVSHNPWRFRLYRGMYQQRYLDMASNTVKERTEECWYLQHIPRSNTDVATHQRIAQAKRSKSASEK